MRYIDEISTGGRKGVFLINLEYKRKSFDKTVTMNFKKALNEMQETALNQVSNASSLNDLLSIKADFRTDGIKSAMKKTYKDVGQYFASESYNNLAPKRKDSTEQLARVWEQQMADYVDKEVGERIKLITNTTEEQFKKVVKNVATQALNDGLSVQDAAKMIKDQIGFNNRYRALRIARTEIVSASNHGSLTGAKSTGLNLNKVWISTKGNRTRHSHADKDLDGQVVGLHESFKVPIYDGDKKTNDTERLQHPGDPKGSAGNVINCRCTQGYKRIL